MAVRSVIDDLLLRGLDAHRAGDASKAEVLYRQVLAKQPAHPDALNLLGVLYQNSGQFEKAYDYAKAAVAAEPSNPDFRLNLGLVCQTMKRHEEAVEAYRQALSIAPQNAEIANNLGTSFLSLERYEEARAAFEGAIRIDPSHTFAQYNLASVLRDQGQLAGAETHFKEAVRLQPAFAQALTGLAQVCAKLDRQADAINAYRRALAINPEDAIALGGFAACLVRIGHLGEARQVYQHLIALAPHEPMLTFEYANALQASGNLDEGLPVYQRVLACEPQLVEAWVNVGHVLREKNNVEGAMDAYERAIAFGLSQDKGAFYLGLALGSGEFFNSMLMFLDHAPVEGTDAERAAVMRSIALLTVGRLAEGWSQYNQRLLTAKTKIERRPEPPSYWKGEDLAGKTIYVWPEQGLGDQIVYGTMLPDLLARAGKVVFESEPRLERVFRRSLPGGVVLSKDSADAKTAIAAADYQMPLASLGLYFRRSFADFPHRGGYLTSDSEKTAKLRARYEHLASGRRIIGLSWKSIRPRGGAGKSTRLMELEPLLRTPNVFFINLQYGDCAAELAEVKEKLGIEVFADASIDALGEMDDVFAQVAALDLVISTSNTTVHVAGSLNVPCWVMLPRGAGALWYWFTEREDSPWYSSVRLFRPEKIGPGWGTELMPRLSQELVRWMEQGRGELGDR